MPQSVFKGCWQGVVLVHRLGVLRFNTTGLSIVYFNQFSLLKRLYSTPSVKKYSGNIQESTPCVHIIGKINCMERVADTPGDAYTNTNVAITEMTTLSRLKQGRKELLALRVMYTTIIYLLALLLNI